MVQDIITRGLINASPDVLEKLNKGQNTENQYILDMSAHSSQIAILEGKAQEIYLNMNLDTAVGIGLDKIGEKVGVTRIQPQPSLVEVQLTLPTPADEDIIIPAGTKCRIVEIRKNGSEYITSETLVVNAGVTSASVICESVVQDYLPPLVEGAIEGLVGFNDFTVTNTSASTTGRRIESDDEYRKRIRAWKKISIIGTGDCIRDYLDNYEGLEAYSLIPRYDGVGTLKVVCDTLESNLTSISEGLYENCMVKTDFPPLCVLPTGVSLQSLTLTITRADNTGNLSDDELKQLVAAQTRTYIEGGLTRYGFMRKGLGIGGALYPSKLIQYLVENIPECSNVKLSIQDAVSVNPNEKLHVSSLTVVIT